MQTIMSNKMIDNKSSWHNSEPTENTQKAFKAVSVMDQNETVVESTVGNSVSGAFVWQAMARKIHA